jgi:hypothetical protein
MDNPQKMKIEIMNVIVYFHGLKKMKDTANISLVAIEKMLSVKEEKTILTIGIIGASYERIKIGTDIMILPIFT